MIGGQWNWNQVQRFTSTRASGPCSASTIRVCAPLWPTRTCPFPGFCRRAPLDNDLDAGHLSRPIKVIRPPVLSASLIFSSVKTLLLYADLLHTFTMLRLTVRYKQSVLGWIWAALQPLALMIVYTVIFSRVAKVSSDGTPYPVFVLTGLLPWALFSSAITTATAGLTNYSHLVTKVYFARESIPFSYVAPAVLDFIFASFLVVGFMIYSKPPVA